MDTRVVIAILALVVIATGCSGTLAFLAVGITARRSRGMEWSHLLTRAVQLTAWLTGFALAAMATVAMSDIATN